MMINRRLFLGGTASVAALAALAACGSSSSSSGSSSASAVKLAASDLNPQDRSALTEGGELRIPIGTWPINYNPLHIEGNTVDNSSILQNFVGASNWIYADDGTFKADGRFCLDFKEEEVDGKTVITLHLNPKAKWNSGEPIQAADYIGVWKACNGEDEAFNAVVASTDGFDQIESVVQGADQFEVITTFKSAYPDWGSVMGGAYPASLTKDVNAFSSWTDASVTDNWSGPFIITNADKGTQTLTLEANPNWWGDKPLLEKVTLKVIDSAQLGTAFGNSELDVVTPIIDASTYEQCAARKDGEIRQAAGLQWRHYTMNCTAGVLQDQKLRQAIVKGIDRVTITEADLQGLPVPASQLQLGNHLFMPNEDGYKDNSTALAFDKDKAISELEELGWTLPEGKKVREKDGQTLTIKYLRLPDTNTSATEGKILQANMAEIGVEIVMDDTNDDDFFVRIREGNFEIVTFTWQGTQYPMANIGQIYGKGSASNYTGVYSDKLEELIDQVAVETDKDKRVELANEADAEIWDLAAVVPIYSRADYTAVPAKLANYGSFGLSTGAAENIGYTS